MNNKNILFFFSLFALLSVIILQVAIAEEETQKVDIEKGKNLVKVNQTMYVKEFVILNPSVESVSYFDEFLNESVGYANVFGGVGKNFLMNEGQVYEVSVSRNTTLIIYREP